VARGVRHEGRTADSGHSAHPSAARERVAKALNIWGCELLDMSPGCRKICERVLATPV